MCPISENRVGQNDAVEWLMAYDEDGSAKFVGLERIVGTVGRKKRHPRNPAHRHVRRSEAQADLEIVPGTGTGDLAG
jgi:hypothetical protein